MALLPATLICLLSAASPLLVLGDVIPESSRGSVPCRDGSAEECSAESSPSDAEEDSSLLQVRRGDGCPNYFAWAAIESAAKGLFDSKIRDHMPFKANHTFVNQSVSHDGCSGTINGHGKFTIQSDFVLDELKCVSATCAKSSFFACTDYSPIQISVSLSANNLAFTTSLDGSASWGSGCPDGAGSAKLEDETASFNLMNPGLKGTGKMDLVVADPPDVSDPSISSLSISYDKVGDVKCSMHKQDLCMTAADYVNTDAFKQGLATAITKSLEDINKVLPKHLEDSGVSFPQLMNEEAP